MHVIQKARMRILLINQDWFAPELKLLGHSVMTVGSRQDLDINLLPLSDIKRALNEELAHFSPDVAVWYDNSLPPYYFGLEDLPFPTIFYSVDSHHHIAAHRIIANLFDVTLVAQKDYAPAFEQVGIKPHWFPLWVSRHSDNPPLQKEFEALFVGTMNASLNPERVTFFESLKHKVPIHVTEGRWWELFPKAKIVVNQTVKHDLNFRVFEALGSGALLLTERSSNGLFDLFEDGKHFVTYEHGNVEEAAQKINYYLSHDEEREKIAAAGKEAALTFHTPMARAITLLQIIKGATKQQHSLRSWGKFLFLSDIVRRLQDKPEGGYWELRKEARDRALNAISSGEMLFDEVALEFAGFCARHEPCDLDLIKYAHQEYPTSGPIAVGMLYCLDKAGLEAEARDLLQSKFTGDKESVLQKVNEIMGVVLKQKER